MAITFVAAGTGTGGTGTATPGMPAGATTGDILILVIEGEGEDANADSPPTGGAWNTIGSIASATDGAVDRTRCSVYWAWYNSGINRVVPDAGNHTIARIYAFRGVDTTDPIDATSTSGSALNATSHTAATGLSSVTNGAMAVLAYTHGDGTGTVPASWANANLVSANNGGYYENNSGSDGTVGIIYGIKTTAGAIGSFTWSTTASEERAWWAMALRPLSESKNVTPGVGALVLAGLAATVFATNSINVSPALGEATLTGFNPTVAVSNNIQVSPDVGVLTFNGYVPDVIATVHQEVSPSLGELLLTGFEPTVFAQDLKEVLPDVGVLTFTGIEPIVFASDLQEILPDTGALIYTGIEPIITVGDAKNVSPGVGVLTYTGIEPTVFAQDLKEVSPDVGVGLFTGFEPTVEVSAGANVSPDVGVALFTGFEPSAVVNNIITTDVGVATLTGFEPTVAITDYIIVSPDVGALTLTGYEPTIGLTNNINVSPDSGVGLFTGFAPIINLTNHINITVGLGELLITGFIPTALTLSVDWNNPTSLTETAGSIVSGALTDVYKDSDATELVFAETVGTPGFDYTFEFGGDNSVPSSELLIHIEGYYDGNLAHIVKLQQWDYNASGWEDVTANSTDFPDETSEQNYVYRLLQGANYISSGNIKLRVVHTSAGNVNHQLHLDKFYLELVDDKEPLPLTGELVFTGFAPNILLPVLVYRWTGTEWLEEGYIKFT